MLNYPFHKNHKMAMNGGYRHWQWYTHRCGRFLYNSSLGATIARLVRIPATEWTQDEANRSSTNLVSKRVRLSTIYSFHFFDSLGLNQSVANIGEQHLYEITSPKIMEVAKDYPTTQRFLIMFPIEIAINWC